jgi:NCS1 nucleoside transporter family
MGAPTGLRQVSISRYAMGWWPAKIIAFLNVVEQVGWSSVGCITGGLALSAVSDGKINLVLGVVIVAIVGLIFSFVGLRAVLSYEKYAWAVFFVIFMVMYGELAPHASLSTSAVATGTTNTGCQLTLFAVVYGSSNSWCSIVSDYYVHYPVNTSKTKVFLLTTCGIAIPTCIGMILGCCVGSTMGINSQWADIYDDQGVGFLLQHILYPRGFAKFLLVLLVMSGIGMNCIAIYSGALSIQQFAKPLSLIPRFFWTLIVFVAILLIGIAGRNHLLEVLQNFLSLLGYWNTSFFIILFIEHYIFRDGWNGFQNYDLEAWNTASKMPIGIAGLAAFAAGIAGAVVGMDETWWVGPIARKIGDYGGDVGNELALVFTMVTYIPVRYLELKYVGR